jgi:hypothetical protein
MGGQAFLLILWWPWCALAGNSCLRWRTDWGKDDEQARVPAQAASRTRRNPQRLHTARALARRGPPPCRARGETAACPVSGEGGQACHPPAERQRRPTGKADALRWVPTPQPPSQRCCPGPSPLAPGARARRTTVVLSPLRRGEAPCAPGAVAHPCLASRVVEQRYA